MNLNELRNQIDKIDDQLLQLLLQRMAVSKSVAEFKIANGLPVLNSGRETEILNAVGEKGGEYGDGMKIVFSTIMDVSRATQHQIIGGGNDLRQRILDGAKRSLVTAGKTVAVSGVAGAYSSQAAKKMFPDCRIAYYTGFEDVFLAIQNGEADFGVVPIENSTAGSVHETYDHIMKYRFSIAKGYDLPIQHCLCAKAKTKLDDIKKIYSHIQGIAQCKDFIDKHGIQAVTFSNTAAAAKHVSETEEAGVGAICSRDAAKEYNLCVLSDEIQISNTNTTRFIAITKDLNIDREADKISLIFSIPHTTGSLYKVLGRFSMYGLNLTKIESRPNSDANFDYLFCLDFSGNVLNPQTLDMLSALSEELEVFEFLGNFKEVHCDDPNV